MNLRILHQDDSLIAVDKPAGFHVHPPKASAQGRPHRIPKSLNCVHLLHRQTGVFVYPVHRLDRATSGVLLFALTADAAGILGGQFRDQEVRKTYFAVARGWIDAEGLIDRPLDSKEARTAFRRVAAIEIPSPVGRYASARYSLTQVAPFTGRMHQIRRHFARAGHPLLGDRLYGDKRHNRFFRERIGLDQLWLKAYSLEFQHPVTRETVRSRARWKADWHRVFDLFGVCPFESA